MRSSISRYIPILCLLAALGVAAGCSRARNDAQIQGDVQNKINSDSQVQSRQITSDVKDGVVTLSGYTNSDAERAVAAADASQVPGVKTVVNNLQVQAPQSAAAAPAPAVMPTPQPTPEEQPAPVERKPARSQRSSRSGHVRKTAPAASDSSNSETSNALGSNAVANNVEPPAQPTPPPPPPPKPVTIAAGTNISVRLIDTIDSEKNQQGETFRATLDSPLTDDQGNVVIPAGYDVTGKLDEVKSASRFAGQSSLALSLTRISAGPRTYNLQTNQYTRHGGSRGKSTAAKVGGGAALGAIIGGLAGGGRGAAIGATVGAGAGTGVSAATKGQQIVLPAETVLNFQLQAPISAYVTEGPNANRPKVND
jgi:BON domain